MWLKPSHPHHSRRSSLACWEQLQTSNLRLDQRFNPPVNRFRSLQCTATVSQFRCDNAHDIVHPIVLSNLSALQAPSYAWTLLESLALMQQYPGGVSAAVIRTELSTRWSAQVRLHMARPPVKLQTY